MWLHGRSEAFRVAYPELRCVAMATFSLGYLYPNVNYIRDDFNLTLISIASNIRKHIHIHIYTYTHHHPAEWTFRALFFRCCFQLYLHKSHKSFAATKMWHRKERKIEYHNNNNKNFRFSHSRNEQNWWDARRHVQRQLVTQLVLSFGCQSIKHFDRVHTAFFKRMDREKSENIYLAKKKNKQKLSFFRRCRINERNEITFLSISFVHCSRLSWLI